ncbi:hypothetical protein ABK040_000814 [Willaertia magna]
MKPILLLLLSFLFFYHHFQQDQQQQYAPRYFFVQASHMEVTSLPLLNTQTKLNFSHYTGNIQISKEKHLFYWFVESASNPERDPVVLWITGGPGCSGLLALLTENGPFQFDTQGKLQLNPYSWNKKASIIYLEQPWGVGFSTNNPINSTNYISGDLESAKDNLQFIIKFFYEEFPNLVKNDFYISGESYGGNYVPLLAKEILYNNNNQKSQHYPINFKGFSIGNPTIDSYYDNAGYFPFMFNHALISIEDYNNYLKACPNITKPSIECNNVMNEIRNYIGPINPYNIYDKCIGKPSVGGACFTNQYNLLLNKYNNNYNIYNIYNNKYNKNKNNNYKNVKSEKIKNRKVFDSQTYIPCVNTTLIYNYLNRKDVQYALHIIDNNNNQEVRSWDICSSVLQYTDMLSSLLPIYKEIISLNSNLRILIYSGDVDSCCPFLGTENALSQLGFNLTTLNHPYFLNGQVAGYIKGYRNEKNFWYATVRGAGHMVPTYKPAEGFLLYYAFLENKLGNL